MAMIVAVIEKLFGVKLPKTNKYMVMILMN